MWRPNFTIRQCPNPDGFCGNPLTELARVLLANELAVCNRCYLGDATGVTVFLVW